MWELGCYFKVVGFGGCGGCDLVEDLVFQCDFCRGKVVGWCPV